jgi:quercetin dioxygenase-like cupin family protein
MRLAAIRNWVLAAALTWAAPGLAQDALSAAPNIFRKVMENDRIRVLEANFKPGDKTGLHSHPDHMLYMLSEGTLVIKPPGRTPYEMTHKAGEAIFLAAQTRAVENDGDKAVRALIVELKTPRARASTRKTGRSKRTGRGGKRLRRR